VSLVSRVRTAQQEQLVPRVSKGAPESRARLALRATRDRLEPLEPLVRKERPAPRETKDPRESLGLPDLPDLPDRKAIRDHLV